MNNSVIILDSIPDKKIKSVGNRCLIQIKKNTNILDYHIQSAKKIFYNPQITVVSGFESKKLKKYLNNKYSNIKYIEYNIDEFTNNGKAFQGAINTISTNTNCLIWNTNHVLHTYAINTIKQSLLLKKSFIGYNTGKGDVGMIINNNKVTNCYYDLPNSLYDLIYITKNDIKKITKDPDMTKLYLFEIINLYIGLGIELYPVCINQKYITIINNMQNIQKVQKYLCSI